MTFLGTEFTSDKQIYTRRKEIGMHTHPITLGIPEARRVTRSNFRIKVEFPFVFSKQLRQKSPNLVEMAHTTPVSGKYARTQARSAKERKRKIKLL